MLGLGVTSVAQALVGTIVSAVDTFRGVVKAVDTNAALDMLTPLPRGSHTVLVWFRGTW